jgi:PAS domain S-box-containing protein
MTSPKSQIVQLALQESAAHLSAILKTAVEGIITIDEVGKIESANAAAQRLFGYEEEEMVGQNVSMLMPEPYHSQHDRYLSHHCRTGEKKIIGIGREVVGKRKDGTIFPMDLSVSEVILPGRRLFTGFVRDISKRKQQEAELIAMASSLEAKNKELESIVHVASHDLRAPLVNIHGFSQELAGACRNWSKLVADEPMSEEVREKLSSLIQEEVSEPLAFILASVTKIDRLLGGLLRLSRLGHAALKIESVDMNTLAAEVLASFEYQIKAVGATVQVGPLPRCQGDAIQLNQVLSNLVDNAIKYRDPARALMIDINGEIRGAEAHYEVRDNGHGMVPEYHSKAFEIFHRLEPGQSEGEGLGLTIAQRIIQRLDGKIWLNSALGMGCHFHISLPLAKSSSP